jgi:hypothetical protein
MSADLWERIEAEWAEVLAASVEHDRAIATHELVRRMHASRLRRLQTAERRLAATLEEAIAARQEVERAGALLEQTTRLLAIRRDILEQHIGARGIERKKAA